MTLGFQLAAVILLLVGVILLLVGAIVLVVIVHNDWRCNKHISTSEWIALMRRHNIGVKAIALMALFFSISLSAQPIAQLALTNTTAVGSYYHMTRPADTFIYPWQHDASYEVMIYEGQPGNMRCQYRSRLIVDLVTVQTISCNALQVYRAPGWDQERITHVIQRLLLGKR
jgi:hypothetical protein